MNPDVKAEPKTRYAVYSTKPSRILHLSESGQTLCGIREGAGSGIVRDGDYGRPHSRCFACFNRA